GLGRRRADGPAPAGWASRWASARLTVFRASGSARAIGRIEEPARKRRMISWRVSSVMSGELRNPVVGQRGPTAGLASQPGESGRQDQAVDGCQAGPALVVQPGLQMAQTLQ